MLEALEVLVRGEGELVVGVTTERVVGVLEVAEEKGQPVGPKTFTEIKELIAATSLPFIVKGVMTSDEAQLAVSAPASSMQAACCATCRRTCATWTPRHLRLND